MDLDEYLFYEKKKDKTFSDRKFAESMGYKQTYFSQVLTKKRLPSAHFLYELDRCTHGKVDVLKMLRDAYNEKGEKE